MRREHQPRRHHVSLLLIGQAPFHPLPHLLGQRLEARAIEPALHAEHHLAPAVQLHQVGRLHVHQHFLDRGEQRHLEPLGLGLRLPEQLVVAVQQGLQHARLVGAQHPGQAGVPGLMGRQHVLGALYAGQVVGEQVQLTLVECALGIAHGALAFQVGAQLAARVLRGLQDVHRGQVRQRPGHAVGHRLQVGHRHAALLRRCALARPAEQHIAASLV